MKFNLLHLKHPHSSALLAHVHFGHSAIRGYERVNHAAITGLAFSVGASRRIYGGRLPSGKGTGWF
ncbi:MAG: hypothetical protein HN675_11105 [Opitutae bacterium]|nr:hypothetical protein [Opitutae bacterium]MBT5381191.1 hypothetical protein [Opitutae bacterium]MBT5692677.1 hypothetical protein [Opitutae bacterium]MBT7853859.1 hypothetical protein [Opitutae bacterium]